MAHQISGTSLSFRLNMKIIGRYLSIFLSMDILICLVFFGALAFSVERNAPSLVAQGQVLLEEKAAAERLQSGSENGSEGGSESGTAIIDGITDYTAADGGEMVLSAAGYTVTFYDRPAQGQKIHRQLIFYLPEETQSARRSMQFGTSGQSFFDRLRDTAYTIELPLSTARSSALGYSTVSVVSYVGTPLTYFFWCFFILFIWQSFSLCFSVQKNARMISKTLKPLRELAETTQTLSSGGKLSREALQKLTGALDSISASHLDSRVPTSVVNDELKPLAHTINQMLARIDEAYQSQSRFVSDASHELRTPIAVIQGYANLLSRWGREDEKTLDESIKAIQSEADGMKDLVEQLLFLARGDKNTMVMDWDAQNLTQIAGETAREIEMISKIHTFDLKMDEEVYAMGDRALIKQLLRILLDNSIKYSPDGGKIHLSVTAQEETVCLAVGDEGIGIPSDALPHIFDRFYRADESRARETGGTGLGLSIALQIAEKHDGHIEVVSRQGFGTRFTVVLPRVNHAI